MQKPLTVSQFVQEINSALGSLDGVVVEGEVDEFKIIHQKWVTFQIKDEKASVGCFMTVWQYKTQIENGMMVRATGRPNLREKGFFSFVLSDVQPTGEGALKRAFELLKQKLTDEGLFALERKRALTRFPRRIALVTSRDAAAYDDFLKVLAGRIGGLEILFAHTQVQGEGSPDMIVRALEAVNVDSGSLDAIVMTRGGGSLEDLHAFNDERVVRAVVASRVPIVVGIGHERDVCLAEMAADVRASTPSNAAELLTPTREELLGEIDGLVLRARQGILTDIERRRNRVAHAVQVLKNRVLSTTGQVARVIDRLQQTGTTMRRDIAAKREAVTAMARLLETMSPQKTLERGYSVTYLASGKILRKKADGRPGKEITTRVIDGEITSIVNERAVHPTSVAKKKAIEGSQTALL